MEAGGEAQKPRREQLDEVVADPVRDRFVEGAFVAEGPDVELEAFQLDALAVGNVVEIEGGEVGLPGPRAKAGELRNLHADQIVAARARIGKALQRLARLGRHSGSGCRDGDGIICASFSRRWIRPAASGLAAYSASVRLTQIKLAGFKSFV